MNQKILAESDKKIKEKLKNYLRSEALEKIYSGCRDFSAKFNR
jgi:hypothetical protein